MSSEWSEWGEAARALLRPRSYGEARAQAAELSALARAARALKSPAPSDFTWVPRGFQALTFDWEAEFALMRGSPLEMLICVGDYSLDQSDRLRQEALWDVGAALMEKGCRVNGNMVSWALACGLRSADAPGRLAACEAWGADQGFDARLAASRCARGAGRDPKAAARAWEWLRAKGAFEKASSWTGGERDLNPAVRALQARDWRGVLRSAEAGVPLDWMDPASGATLWHYACAAGPMMAKPILPILKERALGVALAKTRSPETFGEDAFAGSGSLMIPAGSTALGLAVASLNLDAARFMLDCGADPNQADGKGRGPLHALALRWGSKAQAKAEPLALLLLERGADPTALDDQGLTPAQRMAAKGPLGALSALLERAPADVGGEAPSQRAALEKLSARGGEARAIAEKAAMRVAVGEPKARQARKRSGL